MSLLSHYGVYLFYRLDAWPVKNMVSNTYKRLKIRKTTTLENRLLVLSKLIQMKLYLKRKPTMQTMMMMNKHTIF